MKGSDTTGLLIATGSFRSTQNMAQTTLALLGASLGLSGTAIGAVAAGANLVAVLTMLLITARLATSSAQRAVFAGLLFMTASIASFLAPSPIMLLVGALFLGIAGGLVLPSAATAVGERASNGEDRSSAARGRARALLSLVASRSVLSTSPSCYPWRMSVCKRPTWRFFRWPPSAPSRLASADARRLRPPWHAGRSGNP
jgi:MFS family permease